jgi:uncharacterized OB-fold protein
MLQAWTMQGLTWTLELAEARERGTLDDSTPNAVMMGLLDQEGLTSVVATNCEQEYARPLRPGERLISTQVIEAISAEKKTGLGSGRFITTRTDYVAVPDDQVGPDADPAELAAHGEPVGSMRFRILKFRPPAQANEVAAEKPPRPRPAMTEDNRFFFEGARQGQLLIQRCTSCGTLRHPPLPACAVCQSFDWDTVEASGRGELFSYVVVHYPQVPSFDYPLAIGLVLLEEGTRIVANVEGVDPSDLRIGMPLQAHMVAFDDELSMPVFRPVAEAAGVSRGE